MKKYLAITRGTRDALIPIPFTFTDTQIDGQHTETGNIGYQ